MTIQPIDYLKQRFVCDAQPTQQDFTDLIDTLATLPYLSGYLPLSGGMMTGNLDLYEYLIGGLGLNINFESGDPSLIALSNPGTFYGEWIFDQTPIIPGYLTTQTTVEIMTSSITLDQNNAIVLVDATLNNMVINLPSASSYNGGAYIVKKIDSTMNIVTLSANTNIDDASTKIINTQYDAIKVVSNGTQWWII